MSRYVQVRLDDDLFDWLEENCPAMTKQGYFEQCAIMLRILVERGAIPHPNVYAARVAKEVAHKHFTETDNGTTQPVRP